MVEWITSSGLTDYGTACREMEARADAIFAGRADEAIWLVEHPPLYTAGTSARPGDLTDPDVAAVSFVGSTPVAEYIYTTASAHGKRVQALGGAKNHMVVLPDADIEQAANALMRSFVVIIFDPKGGSLHGLLEAVELGAKQKLVLDAFPESLDLTQSHGMVGTRSNVLYPVLFHLPLKPGLAPPVGVLPPVVGKHLTGHTVFSDPPTVGLQDMFCSLASV